MKKAGGLGVLIAGIFGTLAAMSLFVTSASLGAESSSNAIKTFGLQGTWSPDCAKVTGALRTTWDAPLIFGAPSVKTVVVNNSTPNYEVSGEIKEATRITDEKLKLITIISKIIGPPPVLIPPWIEGDTWESVLEKSEENKYRVVYSASLDGKKISVKDGFIYQQADGEFKSTNKFTMLNERCLN